MSAVSRYGISLNSSSLPRYDNEAGKTDSLASHSPVVAFRLKIVLGLTITIFCAL